MGLLGLFASIYSACLSASPGEMDVSFGESGRKVLNNYIEFSMGPVALGATQDGKIIVSGKTENPFDDRALYTLIGRLHATGEQDVDFNPEGYRMDWNPSAPASTIHGVQLAEGSPGAARILLDNQNSIYLLGWPLGGGMVVDSSAQIIKLNPDGTFNAGFNHGVAIVPGCNYYSLCSVSGLAIDAEGRILISGSVNLFEQIYVARLMPDGTPDLSFGNDGVLINPGGRFGVAQDISVDSLGRIIVSGTLVKQEERSVEAAFILRLNADGTPDLNFGEAGFFTSAHREAADILITPDDSILVTGGLGKPADVENMSAGTSVWKLTSAGTLDLTFGEGGYAHHPAGGTGKRIKLARAGRILVAGGNTLVRFTANGKIDWMYGERGMVTLPAFINDLVIQSDDKAVVAAFSSSTPNEQMLYRVQGGAAGFEIGLLAPIMLWRRRARLTA